MRTIFLISLAGSLGLAVGCGKSGPVTPAVVTPEMERQLVEDQKKVAELESRNQKLQPNHSGSTVAEEEMRHRQGR